MTGIEEHLGQRKLETVTSLVQGPDFCTVSDTESSFVHESPLPELRIVLGVMIAVRRFDHSGPDAVKRTFECGGPVEVTYRPFLKEPGVQL